jgi:glutamyl-tRNA synthetase
MKKIITRFAPSPTGFLHVGNSRTALINWLYARKNHGKFILRIDDTDLTRSTEEYKNAIIRDLKWLGLEWDESFNQNSRLDYYKKAKKILLESGRLYACYETQEELAIKRKLQLSRGLPPIYDRASLKLTKEQIDNYEQSGRKPHYRFLIQDSEIKWQDMVKGVISYQGSNLSDPIIIRADGTMTYMLCSTIDDIDYEISHIIRGEDHVSNTAIQIQMFEAFGAEIPLFGHLSLVKTKDDKISKREGGFEISSLRDKENLEAMAINSFFSKIGSTNPVAPSYNMQDLINIFDISAYSKSPTTYLPEELELLNHKLIIHLEYKDVKEQFILMGLKQIDESFWLAVRPNLQKLSDIKDWWEICKNPKRVEIEDHKLLAIAAKNLPEIINQDTWSNWTKLIYAESGKKGKDLFMPLRLALTGMDHGPELKNLLPLLTREEIINRLKLSPLLS